ncbi:unnamed protein product [Brassica oleracea]|uniref:Uncharacterized protein n=1 Tax=Brassica oleracea TaxID=3712 RepID=A0A3P6B6H6_BRAOL|nr:unnamed protein product [Brassica oleracea]
MGVDKLLLGSNFLDSHKGDCNMYYLDCTNERERVPAQKGGTAGTKSNEVEKRAAADVASALESYEADNGEGYNDHYLVKITIMSGYKLPNPAGQRWPSDLRVFTNLGCPIPGVDPSPSTIENETTTRGVPRPQTLTPRRHTLNLSRCDCKRRSLLHISHKLKLSLKRRGRLFSYHQIWNVPEFSTVDDDISKIHHQCMCMSEMSDGIDGLLSFQMDKFTYMFVI